MVVLLLVLLAHVLWVLSLPAWPSQDGPVHLYYTRVLGALFSKAPSAYQPYFFIKHLLPPYAVYYYALLGLSHVVSLLTADRLIICGYFVSFVFGFRYAAKAIGPNANVTSLLASLLLLNWPLGMGFANYCLSLSFGLWAIGIWLRLGTGSELRRRGLFVALLVLITLSHPVPLLIVLAFGGLDLLCRFVASRRDGAPTDLRRFVPGVLTLAAGALCLFYVKAFTAAHPLEQRTAVTTSFAGQVIRRCKDILITKNIEILYGRWWEIRLYRACLGLILVAGIAFAITQWRRNRAARVWTHGDSASVFAGLLLIALLLLPSDLSGAYYFNERLHLLLWISFLLAGSGWTAAPVTPRTESRDSIRGLFAQERRAELVGIMGIGFTLAVATLLLHVANDTLRPFAERDIVLAHTELPFHGQLAVVLDGGHERVYMHAGPAWDPYFWDTVALLRRNDGIMENAPWLDSPIIPLAPTQSMPGLNLAPRLANSPIFLSSALDSTPALRRDLVDRADVALFSPAFDTDSPAVPSLLGGGWWCDLPQGRGYRVCTRMPVPPPQIQAELKPPQP